MSESGGAPSALVVRLSVPASGGLRGIATDLAAKIAEYVGIGAAEAPAVALALDGLFVRVVPAGSDADVALEFRQVEGALLIHATCEGQRSDVRCPLPE